MCEGIAKFLVEFMAIKIVLNKCLRINRLLRKASKVINELSGKKDASVSKSISRWVATKESHATAFKIQLQIILWLKGLKLPIQNMRESYQGTFSNSSGHEMQANVGSADSCFS